MQIHPPSLEVAPGILAIEVGDDQNAVYLVTGERAAAFIDSGHDSETEAAALAKAWRGVGAPPVEAIVLTHRHHDHVGGAARLARITGAPVVCAAPEQADAEALSPGLAISRCLADGETIDLGGVTMEIVHTPGHTAGSLCVYHRQRRVMFTGDTMLGNSPTVIVPEHDGDMGDYIASLRKLATFDIAMIAPGHGPVMRSARANIEALIRHRLNREAQILGLVGEGGATVESLFAAIYDDLPAEQHVNAKRQIVAHLTKLEREGKTARSAEGWTARNDV